MVAKSGSEKKFAGIERVGEKYGFGLREELSCGRPTGLLYMSHAAAYPDQHHPVTHGVG